MKNKIQEIFEGPGGKFVSSPSVIKEKLSFVKAIIYDWDGVFNPGIKGEGENGTYAEADSMGMNMLRFGFWLEHDHELPVIAIVSGQKNPSAIHLALREHLDHVYIKVTDKAKALSHLLKIFNMKAREVAFCFDDILDLPLASECGVRFLVNRNASPLFKQYVLQNKYCDYITGQQGGDYAIREISELVLGLTGKFNEVVRERIAYGDIYRKYIQQRNNQKTNIFTLHNNAIIEYPLP